MITPLTSVVTLTPLDIGIVVVIFLVLLGLYLRSELAD